MSTQEEINTALHHYQSGNLHEAERLFRQVLKTHPDDAEVLYLLGTIYGHWGKYDPAIQHIKRALQLNPANAEACLALGIATMPKRAKSSGMP
jgi:Flp pilus assembly protein TadD